MADRPEIPPPGSRLDFAEWTRALVRALRTRLPEVAAASQGRRRVVLRYGGRTATITEEGSTRWIRASEDAHPDRTSMSSLYDEDRWDCHSAEVFAKSLAGFFDSRFSGPERTP